MSNVLARSMFSGGATGVNGHDRYIWGLSGGGRAAAGARGDQVLRVCSPLPTSQVTAQCYQHPAPGKISLIQHVQCIDKLWNEPVYVFTILFF